jgi:hypothetical protein
MFAVVCPELTRAPAFPFDPGNEAFPASARAKPLSARPGGGQVFGVLPWPTRVPFLSTFN